MAKSKDKDTVSKAKETAANAVAEVKEAAKEVTAKAKEVTAKAKEPVAKAKEVAKEVTTKAKETTAKAKDAVAKTTKKAAEECCFIEFAGKQISVADITENAKKHWQASNKGVITDIKVYVNTKESKAYYVVNNEDHGDFDI